MWDELLVIPSVSRGIPPRNLKGNFNGIPRSGSCRTRDDGLWGWPYRGKRQLQRWIRGQKINPIQGEERDDGAANKFLLARCQSHNAQARPTHDDYGERINVEERQRAIKKEGERVPLKCREEMGVKKCDGRSRRTAGQTGTVGQRMKQTDRPRQFQSEPACRQGQPA